MFSRRRSLLALVAVVVLVAAGCITPPAPGGTVPECPARSVSTLSNSASSLVRGVSADGSWMVTSNLNGPDTTLTLRHVDALVPPVDITTIVGLDNGDSDFGRLVVGVGDDGEQVIVDGSRWERSTGTLVPMAPPAPGAALLRQSPDRSRTAWMLSGGSEIVVTDSYTDAVLPWEDVAFAGSSPSGRFVVSSSSPSEADLVDRAEGTSVSLADALAAIEAVDPLAVWHDVESVAVSPDGTVVALQTLRNDGGHEPLRHLWVWDTATDQLRDLGVNRGLAQVADDGVVVWADSLAVVGAIRSSLSDGSSRTVYSGTAIVNIGRSFAASTDLRKVAFAAATQPFGSTTAVYLSRCA